MENNLFNDKDNPRKRNLKEVLFMLSTKQNFFFKCLLFIVAIAVFPGCSNMNMGALNMGDQGAKTTATGAAAGAHTENSQIERCSGALGTLALYEDSTADWYRRLSDYRLGPITPVLRMIVQQSNCFVVVERGKTMDKMYLERDLQTSGELRKGSNVRKGQMVAADYTMTPSITFSAKTGGFGGNIASVLFGSTWDKATGVAQRAGQGQRASGSAEVQDVSVMLTIIDNRSGVQVAVAEGSARNTNFAALANFFGFGGVADGVSNLGGGVSGGAGGYTNTPQGKIIIAAFTDAYNNMAIAVQNYEKQTLKGGGRLGTGGKMTHD